MRRFCGTAVALAALVSVPAHGQDAAVPVAAPVATPPAPAVPTPGTLPALGLEPSDFAPMAGSVEWPTVESTTDNEPAVPVTAIRYTVEVTGMEGLGLDDSFRRLSTLKTHSGEEANIAQINRRSVEDRDLIDQLLRSVGHYGGNTSVKIVPPTASGPTRVVLTVDPGPLYTFAAVDIIRPEGATGEDPAKLVKPWIGVSVGDPVDAVRVTTAQDGLAAQIADAGFPFPTVGKPDIVIDHATRTATLTQKVDLGPRGVFGTIRIDGETQGFRDKDVARLARFGPGDPYNGALRDDLRRAMIHTTLFGSVTVKPVAAGTPNADGTQVVDLVVTTDAAPTRTVSASAGYSTGQGIRVEGSWTHRNMFPPQGAVTFRGIAAEREQVAAAEFRRSDWKRRDQTLTFRAGLSAEQQDAYDATTFQVSGQIDRVSNLNWQKPWTYAVGSEFLVTRQRDRSAPNDPNNTFFILAFPGIVTWDKSDNLLDPTRGFRLTARLSPELTLRSGSYLNYVKAQFEGTGYLPFGDFVLAGRLHLGSIIGASRGRIAPNRRFYAGGGGSVRGFDYQGVGPRDSEGSPTGGNSLTEAAIEGRYRFQAFGNDLGVVAFLDAGDVDPGTTPKFNNMRFGAGVGVRYFTSFGPVRIDIAMPINRQEFDPKVAFYVSIGQAF